MTGPKSEILNVKEIPTTDFVGDIAIQGTNVKCAVLYPESDNPIRVIIQMPNTID